MTDVAVEENFTSLVENATENVKNETGRIPATPEGMALAYGTLIFMALIPIYIGSYRSIRHQAMQKAAGEKLETMNTKDAALFPLIASTALFGLYLVFSVFPKEYINFLLTSYFFFLGMLALTHVFSPFISGMVPSAVPLHDYRLQFTKNKLSVMDFSFTSYDLVCMGLCSILAFWYLIKKHWIANNLLGLAFAINGVELLHLNSFTTGALLLAGLFIYDIFWVFGTNVMVTVAKSFDAPIKLVFPQDFLENGFIADNFAMLGLGDIVIPGIFIALLLRFDKNLNRGSNSYFNVTFAAYLLGLLTTIFVMHVFKHAQPALLYLVPACLGAPFLLALLKGDVKTLLNYEEDSGEDESKKTDENDVEELAKEKAKKKEAKKDK